jgi:SAM-dependent methyltransferase
MIVGFDANRAFARAAKSCDAGFGANPAGLVFRHTFVRRLLELFPAGAWVLDLGCGSGEDALALASRGRRVVGTDPAPRTIAIAREQAAAHSLAEPALRFEVLAAESVAALEGPFDGAYSDFGALNSADLEAVGRALAAALRPGAPVLLSLTGPWPLPAIAARALTGVGESRRGSEPQVAGVPVATSYPTPREAREALGPCFAWRGGFALGVLMPGPAQAGFAARSPQAFGLLAMLESVCRGWPLLRALGDHYVLEGVRR